ncbi:MULTISPECIES: site-2 protease family protein [Arthrobacter]|uniref:Zinc metalloprotease n=2 Tax=Arthrobacter TaxID=1663 RepID=A0ABU9KGB9_9MICC|nr:site-2 protease family protein [Arthrobacter sp. YJM1]MDP5225941.1 site-2 protease family protein [Arthrobacter sp. YJM1]
MNRIAGREGIQLGKLWGVPIVLAYSWVIIAAFTVVSFGPMLLATMPGLGTWAYAVALSYAILLLLSVLVHELAHAFSAKAFGWATEKIVLNLWGGHTQFNEFTATPWRSVIVAFAGPLANFILAGAGWIVTVSAEPSGVPGILWGIFTWTNFVIGIFNILPGLPLDGGRLVESIVWRVSGSREKGTIAAGWTGRAIVAVIVLYFIVWPYLQGNGLDFKFAIITLLVAGFLWMGASEAIRFGAMRLRLPTVVAGALAEPALGVPAWATTAQVLDQLRMAPGVSLVLTGPDGAPQALLDAAALARVPSELLSTTAVESVSIPLVAGAYVPEHASGKELIDYLSTVDGREYAVVDAQGRVTGLLRQAVLVAAITGKAGRGPAR